MGNSSFPIYVWKGESEFREDAPGWVTSAHAAGLLSIEQDGDDTVLAVGTYDPPMHVSSGDGNYAILMINPAGDIFAHRISRDYIEAFYSKAKKIPRFSGPDLTHWPKELTTTSS